MDTTTLIRIVAGLLVLVLALLYFMPSYIGRKKRNAGAIFLINLLTGWSVIGWIIVYIWARTEEPAQGVASQPQAAALPAVQGNARAGKLGFLALIAAASVLAIIFGVWLHNGPNSSSTSASPAAGGLSQTTPTYHESNEVLDPYDLSKNPYKWKDHSGILDTIEVPVIMGNGTRMGQVTYPGGCLKFSKMIDEHTAIYEVMVAHEDVGPDGEIAVLLADSDPPSPLRPWRVFVEGPMEAVNGLGQTITLTAIRFEGYFSPPPPEPAQAPQGPSPTEAQQPSSPANVPDVAAPTPVPGENSNPPAAQPEVQPGSKTAPAETPDSPPSPPSAAEIVQQAVELWKQQRYSDAIPLFNQACNSGNADSCYHLGLIYDFGQGVTQDFSRAEALYSKSCNAGNGAACYHSSLLPQSIPGGCNSSAVTRNLSRSCDMGIATSCSMIGLSYIHGCGVAKDTEKGRQLLSKGCSLGDYNACDGTKQLPLAPR
ncbi:MAG: superinfection immunity protein [Terracidiphilus sp.]